MPALALLDDQRRIALSRLPPDVAAYLAAGSWGEITLREAGEAWDRVRLRPRVLRNVARVSTATSVLGVPVDTPFLAAPSAYHGLVHPDAEVATARGVGGAGSLLVLSSRSSARIEVVGDAVAGAGGRWWYQVYVLRDRAVTEAQVRRAAAAGAAALVLTGDTPIVGAKTRAPEVPVPVADRLVNASEHLSAAVRADESAALAATTQDPATDLTAIRWLADVSGLPVVVKGVLRPDDAVLCADSGAAGVIVSNHGGRQLDQAVATATALPEVARAVGGRVPVLVDGGVHHGIAGLAALAFGADAVLVGRPVLWALAADGADGVHQLFAALTEDLARAMALAGAATIAALDTTFVTTAGQ